MNVVVNIANPREDIERFCRFPKARYRLVFLKDGCRRQRDPDVSGQPAPSESARILTGVFLTDQTELA